MKMRKATLMLLLASGVMFILVFMSLAHSYGMLSIDDQSFIRKMFFRKAEANATDITGLESLCKTSETHTQEPALDVVTQWFELDVPQGWNYRPCKKWDGSNCQRLFTLNNTANSIDGEYPFHPFIVFAKTDNGSFEKTPLIGGFERYLAALPKLPTEQRFINGLDIRYHCYAGEKFWNPYVLSNVSSGSVASTAICFTTSRGNDIFYGYFWGFEREKKDFWNIIGSIRWLE